MIKRTLIAIAVVALLATSAHAALKDWYFGPIDDDYAVKVDGSETKSFQWPFEWNYKELTICSIPIKMEVGMYVQVEDCKTKKIILSQVDCADAEMGKGAGDFPCYLGCVKFRVRSNFPALMGCSLTKSSDVINEWSCYYKGDHVIPDDGEWFEVELCVKAWKAKLYKVKASDEIEVGKVNVTVKPNV